MALIILKERGQYSLLLSSTGRISAEAEVEHLLSKKHNSMVLMNVFPRIHTTCLFYI